MTMGGTRDCGKYCCSHVAAHVVVHAVFGSTLFLCIALLYLWVTDSITFPSGWLYPKQPL
jgi:hypothetical protein